MAADLIPHAEDKFHTFQANLLDYVNTNQAALGLSAADVAPLTAAQAAWNTALTGQKKAKSDFHSATQTKDSAGEAYVKAIRGLVKMLDAKPSFTPAHRTAMGLPALDTLRTPVPAPTTRPVGRIESAAPHSLVLHFVDETTPTRRAKPDGVQGCQVWSFVGDAAPADPSAYHFLALDTRTPYTDEHPAADAGKTAFYLLRWQNDKGETGPWGAVVSAKVPL
jgi:hypothetical protein